MADTYKEEETRRIELAEQAMLKRRLVLSGHHYQPRIAWTLAPWSEDDLRSVIQVPGSPLIVHSVERLPRSVIFWPGAPTWSQYAYLIMTEVKAINVG